MALRNAGALVRALVFMAVVMVIVSEPSEAQMGGRGRKRKKGKGLSFSNKLVMLPECNDGSGPTCTPGSSCSCRLALAGKKNKLIGVGPIPLQQGSAFSASVVSSHADKSLPVYLQYGQEATKRKHAQTGDRGVSQQAVPDGEILAFLAVKMPRRLDKDETVTLDLIYFPIEEQCSPNEPKCTDFASVPNTKKCNNKKTPNVVIIYTDDMGYGDCSINNPSSKVSTPNIDKLATQGVSFTDAHSPSTVCSPSRYGLLTGQYPMRRPIESGVVGAEEPVLIEPQVNTLGDLFKEAGYNTYMVGKWHLGMSVVGSVGKNRDWGASIGGGPASRGFDSFYGIPASLNYGLATYIRDTDWVEAPTAWTTKVEDKSFRCKGRQAPKICLKDYHFKRPFSSKKKSKHFEVGPSFDESDAMRITTDEALKYMDNHVSTTPKKPFFLYISLTGPHYPLTPASEFQGASSFGKYGDMLLEIDHRVGQVLSKLEDLGIDSDTIVLFSSDNGPEAYYLNSAAKGHFSTGGFRGGKRDLYEGGHRVPMHARWPGFITPGRIVDQPVAQNDLFSTFANMLKSGLASPNDSVSLWPSFCSDGVPDVHVRSNRPVLHHDYKGNLAIRHSNLKYFMGTGELFDLVADPAEENDLSKDDQYEQVITNLVAKALQIQFVGHLSST